MRNIILYPFTVKQLPIIKYYDKFMDQNEISITPVIANAINLDKTNLNYLNNSSDSIFNDVISLSDISNYLNENYEYVFCNADNSIVMLEIGIDICNKLIKRGIKYNTCLSDRNERIVKKLDEKILDSKNLNYRIGNDVNLILPKDDKLQLKEIKSTVIGVGSVVSGIDKPEICLSISDYYKSKGLQVATIMSDSIYQYIGLNFIEYDKLLKYGVDLSIYFINNYIHELSKKNDLVVVEIPGQFIKYNNELIDSSGVYAYIISQAVYVKKVICCIPVNFNEKEYYSSIAKILNQKFEYETIGFHMSNYLLEFKHRENSVDLPGVYINETEYNEILRRQKNKKINIYNFKKWEEIYNGLR